MRKSLTTTTAPARVWSPQQTAFIDWCVNGSGSANLEAVAGAGKTTTILEAAKQMPGQVAILAYNKKIADEIKDKLRDMGIEWKEENGRKLPPKVQGGTVHSFGLAAYRKTFPKVRIDENNDKVSGIFDNLMIRNNLALDYAETEEIKVHKGDVLKLVSLAKQRSLGLFGSIRNPEEWQAIAEHFDIFDEDTSTDVNNQLIDVAIEVLERSNKVTDLIDFDDMVYLPTLLKLRFWQFDVVMIDEAQDTNPARRALVRALVKKGGRVIAVGDPHQAIYGFTGADNDSLDLIAQDFNSIRLPLTTTYRCPKAVVAFAKKWVSHIEAHETAPEGSVSEIKVGDFMKQNDLDGNSAVLCRLTKPLVSLAMQLIRARIACKVEGRDIAASLVKLCKRWKVVRTDALEERLSVYLSKETTKLLAKKQEAKLAVVEDTVETIRTIIDQLRGEGKTSVSDVIEFINGLFSDNVKGILVLSTIHKSKGREWERVFWLDRANTCPSKWARQKWQMEQEDNLCYVAATRAKSDLFDLIPAPKKEDKTFGKCFKCGKPSTQDEMERDRCSRCGAPCHDPMEEKQQ